MERRALLTPFLLALALAAPGNAQALHSDEESIRTLVKTFAYARNEHNGEAVAALYSEDGEWISAKGYAVRGRPELIRLWNGVTGHVDRAIESIDFAGGNIALVRVATQYPEPIGRRHETFVLVKERGTWSIRVHQSVD
jgi:uncharacterized protein (TIGR02246 family)